MSTRPSINNWHPRHRPWPDEVDRELNAQRALMANTRIRTGGPYRSYARSCIVHFIKTKANGTRVYRWYHATKGWRERSVPVDYVDPFKKVAA